MAVSTYAGNKLLDHVSGKAAFTLPALYAALFTASPTAAGTGPEATYTGYARVAAPGASWGAAAALSAAYNAAIAFGTKTAGTDVTLTHWAVFDAATGGNMLLFGALTAPLAVTNGTTPNMPIGAVTLTAA